MTLRSATLLIMSLAAFGAPAWAEENLAIGPGGRPVGPAWARSSVFAPQGAAATAHPLASQIAVDVLQKGGSAADAAIAANAALGLMEPIANGMGGDLFAIVWDPKTQRLYGLNASGRAPMGRSYQDMVRKAGEAKGGAPGIPSHGSLSVTVPGAVDGWFELHKKFGKLPMRDVLKPTIEYAENGFPVSPVIAAGWAANFRRFADVAPMIEEFDNARATYLIDGETPTAGDIFRNRDLAKTLRLLSKGGRDAFYKGDVARTIDDYMKRIGGDLRYEDFAAHKSEWVEPGCVDYRGYDVCELPPNSQGYAALQMLNILSNVDLKQWPRGSAEVLHYITEAKRLAFEDAAKFYADPAFSPAPLDWLLSKEYGKERFALIDAKRAMKSPGPGEPKLESESDTTYLTVADKDGMMVSLIQSNYRGMGSGLVPDGLGFMLQDRGELFSLEEGHANVYAPGKRPYQTIIPAFVMKDGAPYMSFGLMGGGMQPQGHVQVLVNIIDYGMSLQEAGDAARLYHEGGREPTSVDGDPVGRLMIEPGVPQATAQRLKAMGHNVEVVSTGTAFGGFEAIRRDPATGVYEAATEMRKDGAAIGY